MKQCKKILGLPSISHVIRSTSSSRSAGSNSRDHCSRNKSSERFIAGNERSEPKLCEKSYAKLIADYSKANEARISSMAKCDSTGFFFKMPFEGLARVSSLIRSRSGSPGSKLSTSSFPRSPIKWENRKNYVKISETEILDETNERAEFLDRVVRAHRRATRSNKFSTNHEDESRNYPQNSAKFHLGDHFEKNEQNKEYSKKTENRKNSSPKFGGNESNVQNVSVLVCPRESDKAKNSKKNVDESTSFVVTVTEESKFPSTAETSPLRHIDLRINGEPATNVGTIITKMEKLDVVSMAEKVEIKIPVSSKDLIGNGSRILNSTINLSISSRGKESRSTGKNTEKYFLENSGRTDDAIVSKNKLVATSRDDREMRMTDEVEEDSPLSKVVPWWTTEDSFRQSESSETQKSATAIVSPSARPKIEKRTQESQEMFENEFNRSKELSRAKNKALSAITKMIENELQRNAEKSEMKKTKYKQVRATKSNDLKKENPPLVVNRAKSEQKIIRKDEKNFQKFLIKNSEKKLNKSSTENAQPKKSENKMKLESNKEEKSQSRLPRTYGKIKLLPTQDSESVEKEKELFSKANDEMERTKNSPAVKPIEKKKDGTPIDCGLTVPTRKNSERKSSARIATEGGKKLSKKDEPVVVATIKEIIPKGKKELPLNPEIIYPAKFKEKGPIDWKKHPYCQKQKNIKINNPETSKISNPTEKIEKKSTNPIVTRSRDSSPEKKLLYSVWLRHTKNDKDPNSGKNSNKNPSES